MEDLRKTTFTQKKSENRIKLNIIGIIIKTLKYIRTEWVALLFWLSFIILMNIIFNPVNSANFISNWYNSFIITIIENTKNEKIPSN